MSERKIVGFVFVRGGSKGLPGKNIRPLGGIPLVGRAVQCALACPEIHRVVVSTDDEAIAEVARQYGAEVPFLRPAELAADNAPEWAAWQHAIRHMADFSDLERDVFVSVPATAPLRIPEDVRACLRLFATGRYDIVVTAKPASRHPSFNMVRVDDDAQARLVMPLGQSLHRRQDAPQVYDMTTVAYVARPAFILGASGVFEGRVGMQLVPEERALDIDTLFDFRLAEFLLADAAQENKGANA